MHPPVPTEPLPFCTLGTQNFGLQNFLFRITKLDSPLKITLAQSFSVQLRLSLHHLYRFVLSLKVISGFFTAE
ncbi:hypothetical protein BpHYR1_033904 [Brachionus plicatilis]|uniref:Uncharacterized protein n=1 Tax=Brachionus plicatilis TaxID=10195 RepID=A0A3M7PP18_BRAPC|nr:hypothetical protein BpHYR1_033904 [Brachionus plicatilis]